MRMYELGIPYLIRSLTPLHAGSGARVSGIVDLPIQREAHTGLPVIYGSSIKGALRSWAKVKLEKSGVNDLDEVIEKIFGPEPEKGSEAMGMAVFTDAKLLFFPVKSLRGIYAWITSPFLINRFIRDVKMMMELLKGESNGVSCENFSDLDLNNLAVNLGVGDAIIPGEEETEGKNSRESTLENKVVINVKEGSNNSSRFVVLEDVGLSIVKADNGLNKFLKFLEIFEGSLPSQVRERFVIVHDQMFKHLLSRGIEVVPHIRIDPSTNTVKKGGLWYQENLPPETFLYSFVFARNEERVRENICKIVRGYLQFGGDTTTGLGIVEILAPGDEKHCWCKTAKEEVQGGGSEES